MENFTSAEVSGDAVVELHVRAELELPDLVAGRLPLGGEARNQLQVWITRGQVVIQVEA